MRRRRRGEGGGGCAVVCVQRTGSSTSSYKRVVKWVLYVYIHIHIWGGWVRDKATHKNSVCCYEMYTMRRNTLLAITSKLIVFFILIGQSIHTHTLSEYSAEPESTEPHADNAQRGVVIYIFTFSYFYAAFALLTAWPPSTTTLYTSYVLYTLFFCIDKM